MGKSEVSTSVVMWNEEQSGGKLLHYSDLRGRVFPGEASRSRQRGLKIWTWNVRSFYRAGSFKAASMELGRYKLDVVGCRRSGGTKGAQ